MDYNTETKHAYNKRKALEYKNQQTKGFSWMRFTTWRERMLVLKYLNECNLSNDDTVIDVPCGTGIMGDLLGYFPSSVIAADISTDMIELARDSYNYKQFRNFVSADILKLPFNNGQFKCVLTIGLMHRLPESMRKEALKNISLISNGYLIVSYTIDDFSQRFKRKIIKSILPSHKFAPAPVDFYTLLAEFNKNNLRIIKKNSVAPFLSGELIFLLEKY